MRFREALQVQLQERYRRLYKSEWTTFEVNTKFFLQWIDQVPALRSIVESLRRSHPELDPNVWWDGLHTRRAYETPETEEARAKIVLCALGDIAFTEGVDFRQLIRPLTSESNYNDSIRSFCGQWVEPVVEYLQERLGAESDMLYLLERYRRRLAWFERDQLFQLYQAHTSTGEAIYDRDLRRFLFEQGVDYPFSQPEAPSGKADVIALVESDDPLTCEVKLYDGDRYRTPYLAKGVGQAVRYAEDYGKTVAHLVIFNLTNHVLQLPSDDPEAGWPPRIDIAGVTVFLIVVQAAPRLSASKSGKPKELVIQRSDLVAEIPE